MLSGYRFLLQGCLSWTLASLSGSPRPPLLSHLPRPHNHLELSPVLEISLNFLPASSSVPPASTVHVLHSDWDDVALENTAKCFFSNPIKRRNILGNQRHCRTHKVANLLSEHQETARGKQKGIECHDTHITLEQEYDLVIVELAQIGCWCKWLPLCDFSEPHYLTSRCNLSKNGVTIEPTSPPQNQLPQEAGPGVWHGEVFFWQVNLGGLVTVRAKPQAGFPMQHVCPWATFNLSVWGTKTSKFSLKFSAIPSINEFCIPSPKRY